MALRRITLCLIAFVLLGLVGTSGAAADSFGMRAYGGSGEGEAELLAVFKTAKCKAGKVAKGKKASFFASSTSTNGRYKISIAIYFSFTGFHRYPLELDEDANKTLSFFPVGQPNADFANDYVPPFPVPGHGEIRFSKNGKKLRAGFVPVLWNRDASAQVIVVGGVECRYPKS